MMRWRKLGMVFAPDGSRPWARSHAQCPTPLLLNPETLRVYYTAWDEHGRGRPSFVDLDPGDPLRVVYAHPDPILEPGPPGCFDDNGLVACSVIRVKADLFYMYYAGFELHKQVRYKIFTGLATSADGVSFTRHSNVPVLDRTSGEYCFRGGPFALLDNNRFHIWYVGGSRWTRIGEKDMPVYELRHAVSPDGITWPDEGETVLNISESDEHGFGRPWIFHNGESYELHYSVRRISLGAYRLGFASSPDGKAWIRRDGELGLDVGPMDYDRQAIMYSALVTARGKTYCFYNGNNFGEEGFAVAVREE